MRLIWQGSELTTALTSCRDTTEAAVAQNAQENISYLVWSRDGSRNTKVDRRKLCRFSTQDLAAVKVTPEGPGPFAFGN